MALIKYPKRIIELDSSKKSLQIPIGRSARLPPALADNKGQKNSGNRAIVSATRIEADNNLYFNERTVSKTHAYLKVDFEHKDLEGKPSLVIEDNGSQHGLVWEGKRIPQFTKIRVRKNQPIGLVDLMNKNHAEYPYHDEDFEIDLNQDDESDELSLNSVLDPDTIFFKPHHSWKSASVEACKLQLEFNVKEQNDGRVYLEVKQSDPKRATSVDKTSKKIPEQAQEDEVIINVEDRNQKDNGDDDTNSVVSLELAEHGSDDVSLDLIKKNGDVTIKESESEITDGSLSGTAAMLFGEFDSDDEDDDFRYQEPLEESEDELTDERGYKIISEDELDALKVDHQTHASQGPGKNHSYLSDVLAISSCSSNNSQYDKFIMQKLKENDVFGDEDDEKDLSDSDCETSFIQPSQDADLIYNNLKRKLQDIGDDDLSNDDDDDDDSEYYPEEHFESTGPDQEFSGSESDALIIEVNEIETRPTKKQKLDEKANNKSFEISSPVIETTDSSSVTASPSNSSSTPCPSNKSDTLNSPPSALKSQIVAGISGIAVGSAMTFATLVSLGEKYLENSR